MFTKNTSHRFLVTIFSLLTLLLQTAISQDTLNSPPAPAKYGSAPMSPVMEPTTTPFGTVGMSNVISAEPLGDGRLGMQLRGNFYQQSRVYAGTPGKDAQITTLNFGAALGLNPYLDGFVSASAYNIRGGGVSGSGAGSSVLGAQGTLPLPEDVPIRLGLQVASLFGTAGSQINTTPRTTGDAGADGYNYFETRKYTDLMARVVESFVFTGDDMGVKIHLNEGIVSSFQPDKGLLLLTGAGVQFIVMPPLVLGVEVNDRTFLDKPAVTDPLWITPSVTFRTPAHMNIELGADVSMSKDRSNGTRALEPWRAFAGISLSYDTETGKKLRNAEKERENLQEKIALAEQAKRAEMAKDSLAAAKDSLAQLSAADKARQQAIADSIAAKARQDSLNLASNLASAQSNLAASQSSLDATQRALQEERSKRSEAEKQLLSTGLLLLDAVYFNTGKTDISINSKPYLNIIAKMLTKYPKLQIEVAGHTDNVGGFDYNMNLSQGRAGSVEAYMQMVEPSLNGRLTAKGYGYTRPKASNASEAGRKFNRRTELEVMNKEVLKEYNP